MSKKKILIPLIIFSTILTTGSVYTYQILYSPNFLINAEDKFIIIEENTDFNGLIKKLEDDTLINDILSFSFLSKLMEYQENIKIGAYKVKMNMSNYDMITMLRSGNQTPIKLTFTYARKIEDLAEKITAKLKYSSFTENVAATSSLSEFIDVKFLFIALPAQKIREVFKELKINKIKNIILCSKGIEISSSKFLTEVINELTNYKTISVLSGPSFSIEVSQNLPTAVTLATEKKKDFDK